MRAPSPYRLPKWRLWPCLELDVCNRVHGHCVRNRYESSDPGFLGPSTMVCPVYQRRLLGQGTAMEHARRRRTHMAGLVVNTAATSPAVSSLHHVRSVWRVVQTPSAAESPSRSHSPAVAPPAPPTDNLVTAAPALSPAISTFDVPRNSALIQGVGTFCHRRPPPPCDETYRRLTLLRRWQGMHGERP